MNRCSNVAVKLTTTVGIVTIVIVVIAVILVIITVITITIIIIINVGARGKPSTVVSARKACRDGLQITMHENKRARMQHGRVPRERRVCARSTTCGNTVGVRARVRVCVGVCVRARTHRVCGVCVCVAPYDARERTNVGTNEQRNIDDFD